MNHGFGHLAGGYILRIDFHPDHRGIGGPGRFNLKKKSDFVLPAFSRIFPKIRPDC
jgi:hypothetical protein